jgi:hypothetical protein
MFYALELVAFEARFDTAKNTFGCLFSRKKGIPAAHAGLYPA